MIAWYKPYATGKEKNLLTEYYSEWRNFPDWLTGDEPIERYNEKHEQELAEARYPMEVSMGSDTEREHKIDDD